MCYGNSLSDDIVFDNSLSGYVTELWQMLDICFYNSLSGDILRDDISQDKSFGGDMDCEYTLSWIMSLYILFCWHMGYNNSLSEYMGCDNR